MSFFKSVFYFCSSNWHNSYSWEICRLFLPNIYVVMINPVIRIHQVHIEALSLVQKLLLDNASFQTTENRICKSTKEWFSTSQVLCLHAKSHQSCPTLCNPMACQSLLSMGLSRQEYWSGWPCPPLGDLPDPGIEPTSFMSPALAGGFFMIKSYFHSNAV